MYIRQVTLILHQLPVTASTARLWGLHKPLHHLFSQYHQHHTYCLEDSCQLQLNHHFFWPCADAGLQTHFTSDEPIVPDISQQHHECTLASQKKECTETGFCCLTGLCLLKSSILQTTLIFKLMLKNKNECVPCAVSKTKQQNILGIVNKTWIWSLFIVSSFMFCACKNKNQCCLRTDE